MLNQGPRSKFLSGEGGGAIFGSVIFVKLLFVYFIFIFAKQWGGAQSPPALPSARSLLTPLKVKEWGV